MMGRGRDAGSGGERERNGEIGQGKGREGSTWIFVQGNRVPSYATAYTHTHQGSIYNSIYKMS